MSATAPTASPHSQQPTNAGPDRITLAVAAFVMALVLAAQVPLALDVLDPDAIFEAGRAKAALIANALIAAFTVIAAAALPARWRIVALVPGTAVAAAALAGMATVGGHVWDLAMALLTFGSAWLFGSAALRLLRAERLAGVVLIELVVGLGLVGLVTLLLGRLGLIAWWSVGLLTIVSGAAGIVALARAGWSQRNAAWEALTMSPVATACAGLLLLQLGWIVVWLSAPEIMFDPLYGKTYLPQLWAETGEIGPLLEHPVLNVAGLTQVVAVAGHAVGAPDVGRQLQMVTWVVIALTFWWLAGRRSSVGPLAALAVAIAPHVVWQATTAFDDLVLSAGALALAIAVLRTVRERDAVAAPQPPADVLRTAFAIGLVAGACVWLKLNMISVIAVLAGGWILFAGPAADVLRRAAGVLSGGVLVAAPVLAMRWIDTGNPIFPTYNALFKSSHYPTVNEQYNFPFWAAGGLIDLLKTPYFAITRPALMNEAAPPGAFGLLIAAMAIAGLIGWRAGGRRVSLIVWASVAISLLLWWVQFRYLRYLLPTALVAVMLIVVALRGWQPRRSTTIALLVAAGAATALYLPTSVASFWNVPGRDLPFGAAFGRWSAEDYERTVFPEKDTLDAFARIAPEGASAVSDAHQRVYVLGRELSPPWEAARLMELDGRPPTTGTEALRRLRAIGVEWAIVSGVNRTSAGQAWIPALLKQHGEIAFSDRGWDLYRLVDRPTRPEVEPCDDLLRGEAGCWSGLDRRPGLTLAEAPGGVGRIISACEGQTVGVEVTTAPAGQQSAQVAIDSDGHDLKGGINTNTIGPGERRWVYATAPAGTRAVNVHVVPGADGAITRLRVGTISSCGP